MLRRPMTIALVSTLLASCASTELGDAKKPAELASALAQPPAALEQSCAGPMRLARKALTEGMSAGEVERIWSRDRVRLIECMDKFAALVRWRRARDAGLAGKSLPALPKGPDEPSEAPPAATDFRNPFAGLFGGE